jgi:hypothetical protein
VPYHDFDADLATFERQELDPFIFRLGGRDFRAISEPMFGDVVELYNAPPPEVDEETAVLAMTSFIRRMLHPDDRAGFDEVLYRIPTSQASVVLLKLGAQMAEHFTRPFLTGPGSSSQRPPESNGQTSKPSGDSRRASSRSRQGGRSGTSTGTSRRAGTNGRSSS